jgi:hypothetical protein
MLRETETPAPAPPVPDRRSGVDKDEVGQIPGGIVDVSFRDYQETGLYHL